MRKEERDNLRLFAKYGCEVLDVRTKNHYTYKLKGPRGNVFSFTVPNSGSDCRGVKQREKDLRRYAELSL